MVPLKSSVFFGANLFTVPSGNDEMLGLKELKRIVQIHQDYRVAKNPLYIRKPHPSEFLDILRLLLSGGESGEHLSVYRENWT